VRIMRGDDQRQSGMFSYISPEKRVFVGLNADDPVWDPTVFTKNRDRLLAGDVAQAFFEAVLAQAQAKRLLSAEHFTVDGTLIEAWASQKGLVRREDPEERESDDDPGNPTVNFRGERRSNETHVSASRRAQRSRRPGARGWRAEWRPCRALHLEPMSSASGDATAQTRRGAGDLSTTPPRPRPRAAPAGLLPQPASRIFSSKPDGAGQDLRMPADHTAMHATKR
jgi:hypothetical protein